MGLFLCNDTRDYISREEGELVERRVAANPIILDYQPRWAILSCVRREVIEIPVAWMKGVDAPPNSHFSKIYSENWRLATRHFE